MTHARTRSPASRWSSVSRRAPATAVAAAVLIGSIAALADAPAPVLTKTDIPAGLEPNGMVMADFDGDGDQDLASIDRTLQIVKIRRNSGDGLVYSNENVALASPPDALAFGKFDANAFPDLVVVGGGDALVVLNAGPGGDGRLQLTTPHLPIDAGGVLEYVSVAVADLDKDGDGDLMLGLRDPNSVTPGFGSFIDVLKCNVATSEHNLDTTLDGGSKAIVQLAAGDLTGDGFPELLVMNPVDQNTAVFQRDSSNPDLLADAGSQYYRGVGAPQSIAIGDVTGDGKPDFVTSGWQNRGTFIASHVEVYRNTGASLPAQRFSIEFAVTVGPQVTPVPVAWPPLGVAVGDVNGDGHVDVLVGAGESDKLIVQAFRTITGAGGSFASLEPDGQFTFDGPDQGSVLVAGPLDTGTSTDVVVLGLAGTMSVFKGPAGGGGGGGGGENDVAAATEFAISTKSPPRDGQKWTFTAQQADVNATSVRVQSARTALGVWEDLPNGAQMKGNSKRVFTAKSLDVTSVAGDGPLFFRTVSSAPGLRDGVSVASGPYTVTAASPSLSVALTAKTKNAQNETLDAIGGQASPGEQIEYSVDVTNTGSGAAADLKISVKVPKGTSFVSASDGATPQAKGVITLNIGSVLPGDTRGRIFLVQVLGSAAPGSKITAAAAKVTAVNAKGTSASFVTRVRGPLSLQLEPDAEDVDAGEDLRFVLEVRNNTASEITGVRVDLPVPSGSSYLTAYFLDANESVIGSPVPNPGGGLNPAFSRDLAGLPVPNVAYFLGNVAANATVKLELNVRAGYDISAGDAVVGGLYVARGTLAGKEINSGTPGVVRVPVTNVIPATRPALEVLQYANSLRELSPSGTVVAAHGEEFGVLVITVNRGTATALRTRVNGEISTGAEFVLGSFELAGVSLTGSPRLATTATGTWSVDIGDIDPGQSAVVFFKARVRAATAAGAVVSGDHLGMRTQGSSDDFAAPVEAQPSPLRVLVPRKVQLTSRVIHTTHSELAVGEEETVTWSVTNNGQVAARDVVATLELPPGMRCVFATVRGQPTAVAIKTGKLPVFTTPVGAVAVGESVDVSFVCHLDKLPAGSGDLLKYLSVDGFEAGAAKKAKVRTSKVAASTARKDTADTKLFVGVTLPYRVNIGFTHQCTVFFGNLSATVASNVQVQLMIPPGVKVQPNGISYGGKIVGNYVLWDIGDLKAFGTAGLPVNFDVPSGYTGDDIPYAAFIYSGNAPVRKSGIVRAYASTPNLLNLLGDGFAHILKGFYAEVESADNALVREEIDKFDSSSTVGTVGGTTVLTTVDGLFLVNVGPDKALVLGPSSALEWDSADARVVAVQLPHDSVILMGSPDAVSATVACFGKQTVRYVIDNAVTGVECQQMSILAAGGRAFDATGENYLTMNGGLHPVPAPILGLGLLKTPNVNVSAGGGSLVAAGAGNVVPTGAGRLVSAGGLNVIGMNDAHFVADGTGRMTGTNTPESVGKAVGKAGLVGLDGATLIGLDGATLIGLDGATLIGLDGATLIGPDGGTKR